MAYHRVQVQKQESTALGGDDAESFAFDVPIDAQEDRLEAAGFYIQDDSNRDETTLIARSGNDMTFKDGNNTTKTLTELLGGEATVPWQRHFLLMGC